MTRYRYRYDAAAARARGVGLHPYKDIMLIAPDASDIESVPLAECWLFVANTLVRLPPYVELIGGLSTKEQAAASAAGLQVCPTCGDWLPRDWTDFECHGPGRHDVGAVVLPRHPTRTDMDREFKQATVSMVAVAVLIVLVLAVLGTIAWLER